MWQRGTSIVNPSANVFIADRFKIAHVISGILPSTITHSRRAITNDELVGSTYYYSITTSDSGNINPDDRYWIDHCIENGTRLFGGDEITISFYARSSISNKKIYIGGVSTYGSSGNPSNAVPIKGKEVTLTSSWVRYNVTLNIPSTENKVIGTNNDGYTATRIGLAYGTNTISGYGDSALTQNFGAGTIDIAQIKVEVGDKATPFIPRLYTEELALCQRYYESGNMEWACHGATFNFSANIQYKVTKRAVPTFSNVITEQTLLTSSYPLGGSASVWKNLTDHATVYVAANGSTPQVQINWVADAEIY